MSTVHPGDPSGQATARDDAPPTQPPPRPARPPAPAIANIPAELKARPQWVVWRYVLRKDKWTKSPHQPRHPERGAKADVPSTWATLDEALAAYRAGDFDGIGFEFSRDDPYFGSDVDNCLKDGQVMEWAVPIVAKLKGTYGEISPSGNGVKFIGKGKLPAETGTNAKGFGPDGTGGLELYDHGRFFTLTGNVFGGEPGVMP
jgi:putative DNA primase/helicase